MSDMTTDEASSMTKRVSHRATPFLIVVFLLLLVASVTTNYREKFSSFGTTNIIKASILCSRSDDADESRIAQLRKKADAKGERSPDFGLVVAHCKENYTAWIDSVDNITLPGYRQQRTSWEVVVYERCQERAHQNYSRYQINAGSEECSAYMKYIIDRYDDLPEIVYFLQPDAMAYNTNKKQDQHTKFSTLQELVDESAPLMISTAKKKSNTSNVSKHEGTALFGFLNLGTGPPTGQDVYTPNAMYENPAEVIALMKERAPAYDNSTQLRYIPGACFAVHRDRIWANPPDFYKDVQLSIYHFQDVRRMCWNLERTWHVIFGEDMFEPPRLPTS